MGLNVKFTAAVIAVVLIGFTASSYFFSTQPISSDWMFDKSKYIQEIDACLETHSFGDISINSFGKSFVATTLSSFMFNTSNQSMILTATNDTFFPSFTHFLLWFTTGNII